MHARPTSHIAPRRVWSWSHCWPGHSMLQLGVIFGTGGRPSSKQWRGGTLYPSAASDQPTVVSATDRSACMGV